MADLKINEDEFLRNFLRDYRGTRKTYKQSTSVDETTRQILNKVRVLTEEMTQNPTDNKNEVVINKKDEKFMEFSNNITKFVGALKTDEKAMIVYPKEGDVVFNGVITDMNNLKFQFRYNDQSGGLYIWADSMLLTKEVTEKLAKLAVIREQWKDYWANNISAY